jgi:hypothetical protein
LRSAIEANQARFTWVLGHFLSRSKDRWCPLNRARCQLARRVTLVTALCQLLGDIGNRRGSFRSGDGRSLP